jgi:hypothetical protein
VRPDTQNEAQPIFIQINALLLIAEKNTKNLGCFGHFCHFYKKLPKVNNHPMGESVHTEDVTKAVCETTSRSIPRMRKKAGTESLVARVTRCVCEKNRPKCSPSHFLSKLILNFFS